MRKFKKSNNGIKFNSYVFLPVLAFAITEAVILIILAVFILILATNIILVLIRKNKDTISEEHNISDYTDEDHLLVIDDKKVEAMSEEHLEEDIEEIIKVDETPIRYNYSLEAHIMLAPKESLERYLDIKNYILRYSEIKISDSWKFERFKYGARTLAKITLQGQVLRIYFDLDPKEFENTVYNVKDESSKVNHRLTPTQLVVRGNRGVKHAKELIDLYFSKLGVEIGEKVNYEVPNYEVTREDLIIKGLIKVPKQK